MADREADSEAQVGETGFAFIEIVQVGEDVGEGGEEDVEIAVRDGKVEGH